MELLGDLDPDTGMPEYLGETCGRRLHQLLGRVVVAVVDCQLRITEIVDVGRQPDQRLALRHNGTEHVDTQP